MCDHCGCRSFEPIAELTADHERILELAWRVAEGATPDEATSGRERLELMELLDVHALKEELGLYPLLIGTGDLEARDSEELEQEHRDVQDELGGHRFGRREYFALAAHIEVEELELFSAARFAFDEEEWEDMTDAHHAALHHRGVVHSHGDDASAPDHAVAIGVTGAP